MKFEGPGGQRRKKLEEAESLRLPGFLKFLCDSCRCFLSALAEDELEPARKRRREQLAYLESEEFQKILKAKSKHTGILKEVRAQKVRNDRDTLQTRGTLSWD